MGSMISAWLQSTMSRMSDQCEPIRPKREIVVVGNEEVSTEGVVVFEGELVMLKIVIATVARLMAIR